MENKETCPAESLLKTLSGKWKLQIFKLAVEGPLRFSQLLKQLEGSNKQSVAVALKELETDGLLHRETIQEKPLHVEYTLSEKGRDLIGIFEQIERLNPSLK
jgi:DNA-binding HxlR family transcriptional regulator